jgi:hypothetical protein
VYKTTNSNLSTAHTTQNTTENCIMSHAQNTITLPPRGIHRLRVTINGRSACSSATLCQGLMQIPTDAVYTECEKESLLRQTLKRTLNMIYTAKHMSKYYNRLTNIALWLKLVPQLVLILSYISALVKFFHLIKMYP